MSAELHDITHTIQLAVAPVFLLTALGTTLSVFATRLGRIVDRARRLESQLEGQAPASQPACEQELLELAVRARLIQWALTAGTVAALLVCLLIAVAFLGYLFEANLGTAVAVLFIMAVGGFVAALVCFLREVFLATRSLRFGPPPARRP
jgi:Protein of unknown function (DUF2721)